MHLVVVLVLVAAEAAACRPGAADCWPLPHRSDQAEVTRRSRQQRNQACVSLCCLSAGRGADLGGEPGNKLFHVRGRVLLLARIDERECRVSVVEEVELDNR